MSTLNDTVSWVCDSKLKRKDIRADVLGLAKKALLSICAKIPFDELSTIGSEIPVVAEQNFLVLTSLSIAGIKSLRLSQTGSTLVRRLKRSDFRAFDNQALVTGAPFQYARVGTTIYFNTLPPATPAYTVRPYYWSQVSLSNPIEDTTLPWPTEWDELLDYETLYRTYLFLERQQEAMALVQGAMLPRQSAPKRTVIAEMGFLPRLWNDLLRTTSAKEGIDEDFSINPYIARYNQ